MSTHLKARESKKVLLDAEPQDRRDRVRMGMALLMFVGATVGALVGYLALAQHEPWRVSFVKAAAFVVFSAFPGWLYVRFLEVRAVQVRTDYMLALHRLGVDDARFLPEPPKSSIYYEEWEKCGGPSYGGRGSIYLEKFEAQYGHSNSSHGRAACLASLLPVAAVGFICAVGWGSILLDPEFLSSATAPSASDAIRFGFLGAYTFVVQMFLRRYLQQDLRPSAYVSATVRFIVVTILTFVVYCAWPAAPAPEQLAVAFFIGFFPIVGMQWLRNVVAAMLHRGLPSLGSNYPLSDLDGLNVWYEAELLEVGIEDMQNLMTANVVDLILNTRVPVGRLIDWIDQAALYLQLPADPNRATTGDHKPRTPRAVLRWAGVRCATDLEAVFRAPGTDSRCPNLTSGLQPDEEHELHRRMLTMLDEGRERPSTVATLLKTFRDEPCLILVRNWRHDWRSTCAAAEDQPPPPALGEAGPVTSIAA